MSEIFSTWAWELARASLVLTAVAMEIGIVLRIARPVSPRLHRAAWCLALLVGWLFIHLTISVPWHEPTLTVEETAVAKVTVPTEPALTLPNLETSDRLTPEVESAPPNLTEGSGSFVAEAMPEFVETPSVRSVTPDEEQSTATVSPIACDGNQSSTSVSPIACDGNHVLPAAGDRANRCFSFFSTYGPAALFLLWLAGIAVILFRWLLGYIRSIRSMSTALLSDEESSRQWQTLLDEHHIQREIPLRLTQSMGPLLCRWPDGYELVVPAELWKSLSPAVRLGIMRHELAHYRRGDVWKSLAVRILALPHWFNPVAWWAVRRFDEAAEWACDEAAVEQGQLCTDYARTLLALAESSLGGGSCHPSMSRLNLPARIRRILTPPTRKDSLMKKATLMTLTLLLLTLSLVRIDLVAKTPAADEAVSQAPVELGKEASLADLQKPVENDATSKNLSDATLRYNGKTFDEWKKNLDTETNPEQLAYAIEAFTVLGNKQGRSQEAAESIVHMMRTQGYRFFYDCPDEQTVFQKAMSVFIGYSQDQQGTYRKLSDAIPYETGIPVLCRELEEGNEKSRSFVLIVFSRMVNYQTPYFPPVITDASERDSIQQQITPALAKFIEDDTYRTLRSLAIGLLAYLDRERFCDTLGELLDHEKDPDMVAVFLSACLSYPMQFSEESIADWHLKLTPASKRMLLLLHERLNQEKTRSQAYLAVSLLANLAKIAELKGKYFYSPESPSYAEPIPLSDETSKFLKDLTWQTIRRFDLNDLSSIMTRNFEINDANHFNPCERGLWPCFFCELKQDSDFARYIDEAVESEEESLSEPAKAILAEVEQLEQAEAKHAEKIRAGMEEKQPTENNTKSSNVVMTDGDSTVTADPSTPDPSGTKTISDADREKFRYQGKTFEEWKKILATELNVESRVEAIKAMGAFGARGYGKEAAETVVQLMREYHRQWKDEYGNIWTTALHVLGSSTEEGVPATPGAIPAGDVLSVLCRELKDGNVQSQCFVFEFMNMRFYSVLGNHDQSATQALAEFIREQLKKDRENFPHCHMAFLALMRVDPTGETTRAILQEELIAYPENYPLSYFSIRIYSGNGLSGMERGNDISPGERGVIRTMFDCLDEKYPASVRQEAMLDLACVLSTFDTLRFDRPEPKTISEETSRFGQEMMNRLVAALGKTDAKFQQKIVQLLSRYTLYNARNTRTQIMAEQAWKEAQQAALADPSDAGLAEHENVARSFYWILAAKPTIAKTIASTTKSSSSSTRKANPSRVLAYEVDEMYADPANMKKIVNVVRQRVHTIAPSAVVSQAARQKIAIYLYRDDDTPATIHQIDQTLSRSGTLEFRILANQHDHQKLIDLAKESQSNEVLDEQGKRLTWWVPIADNQAKNFEYNKEIIIRTVDRNTKPVMEILVVNDPHNVTGEFIKESRMEHDSNGRPCVQFLFDETGGDRFGRLTGENLPDEKTGGRRQLGIILDGRLYSAPRIWSRITERGIITGGFTEQEATDIAVVLNSGSLPTPLKLVASGAIVSPEIPSEVTPAQPSSEPSATSDSPESSPAKPTGSTDEDAAYRIEPPDLVQIKMERAVPKSPYSLKKGDRLSFFVLGSTSPDSDIQGQDTIDEAGEIGLGPAYGKVNVLGLTVDEATQVVLKQFEKTLDHPKVVLEIMYSSDFPPVAEGLYLVGPDGKIPLREKYGSVQLEGKTLAEAKKTIEEKLSQYFDKPRVSVSLFANNSKVFYLIDGNDKNDMLNGRFVTLPVNGKEKVLDEIHRFQGWGDLTKTSIRIVRPRENGEKEILPVDYEAIVTGRDTSTNYQILPGDRVYVDKPQ